MVRPATWLDAMTITVMWMKMHNEITPRKSMLDEVSDSKNLFLNVLSRVDDPNWIVLVAEDDGKPIGFIMSLLRWPLYSKHHVIGSCEALYVNSEDRGNKEFRNLVDESIRIAKSKGVNEFEVICRYDNRMLHFYDKLGFEPVQIVLRQKEVSNG